MKKRVAIIADIHGNLEALEAIISDIKKQSIDEIICLGDSIGLGLNSKECIDLLIDNNVKSVLGDYEIFLLKEIDFDSFNFLPKKEYYKYVLDSLTDKEISYIKKCPLYYEINIEYENSKFNSKYILCHYLINNEKNIYPFELNDLKKDINLWKKYNDDKINYLIGHLHNSFNINEVNGIIGDYIEDDGELTNIGVIDSAGCTKGEYTSYMILEISKNMKFLKREIRYDREKFIDKLLVNEFPNKQDILEFINNK